MALEGSHFKCFEEICKNNPLPVEMNTVGNGNLKQHSFFDNFFDSFKVSGDANSFYRAVCKSTTGDDICQLAIRCLCVKAVVNNWFLFAKLCNDRYIQFKNRHPPSRRHISTFRDLIANLSSPNEIETNASFYALSIALERRVIVHSQLRDLQVFTWANAKKVNPILIGFLKRRFNAILPIFKTNKDDIKAAWWEKRERFYIEVNDDIVAALAVSDQFNIDDLRKIEVVEELGDCDSDDCSVASSAEKYSHSTNKPQEECIDLDSTGSEDSKSVRNIEWNGDWEKGIIATIGLCS